MVIKCGDGIEKLVMRYIFLIFCFMFYFSTIVGNLIQWLIFVLPSSMILILSILQMIRTLYFSKDGCVISLLCFDKFYRWDEIKIRRIQKLRGYHWSEPYKKAVYFCSKRKHRFSWLKPNKHLLRPMSFFYVHFLPDRPLEGREKWYPTEYAVDEKEFMDKMAEWGVELEEEERTAFF